MSALDDLAIWGDERGKSFPFQMLDQVPPIYILPEDQLAEEVLIPSFMVSKKVDCMVGFFSSAVLASLASGLATFINQTRSSFRLVVSPLLQPEDMAAIEKGIKPTEDIANRILEELIISEDLIQQHTLKCLTYLLQEKRVEIKIALMKDGFFHPKIWLFENSGDVVAVHGSGNATFGGTRKNIEQLVISRSWQDKNQQYVTKKLATEFNRFWEHQVADCIVVPISEAVKKSLVSKYHLEYPPSEEDLNSLYARAKYEVEQAELFSSLPHTNKEFIIPSWIRFNDGPFNHQGRAVNAWCESNHCGILEMATGSGKTITSMIGANRLYLEHKPLLIVVAAPYIPLIEQWCQEINQFGLNPINLTTAGNASKRAKVLMKLRRRLRTNLTNVEVVVVSNDYLCTNEFQAAVQKFDCTRLLIADEVHNLGRPSFIKNPPQYFEYRLGLSATPVRQYDEEGTEELLHYFGPVVFRFSLEEAIGRCLVEYDYYVHTVYLTDAEMDDWFDLTGKIKQLSWRSDDKKTDDYLAKLLRDRRSLLETASRKVSMLENVLEKENVDNLMHTLIYNSAKGPKQIKNVNKLLRTKNIIYHQLTAQETVNREKTKELIQSFQNGEIQVLTAMRVLDEGVNIPQISKAYILASTTVEREWVQRRGRVLRTCNSINKKFSVIHDFLALPEGYESGLDPEAKSLVRSELLRTQEFARLARNAGRPDGPLATINKMAFAAYL